MFQTITSQQSLLVLNLYLCELRIGANTDDLSHIGSVHVAVTKGKGTLCACIRPALAPHGFHTRLRDVGTYEWPHQEVARERSKIDSLPITGIFFTE